jgi:murein DD-endopeptidase MepM/ murein hydrolase activator NlpD
MGGRLKPIAGTRLRERFRVATHLLSLAAIVVGCSGTPSAHTPTVSLPSTPAEAPSPSAAPSVTAVPSPTNGPSPTPEAPALPPISYFREHPSDQFLIRMSDFTRGTPFLGARAANPHSGAHVHFENRDNRWPAGGTAPENYPPVYAVADGIVDRVDYSFPVGDNDRYGIALRIAQEGQAMWVVDYSIEPMSPEPSPDFYRPFLLVKQGDFVRKGDIIAYVYTPPKHDDAIHIHFELIGGAPGQGVFQAPAIFTPEIVAQFYAGWHADRVEGGKLKPCMGWKLGADQNPFGTGAADCLNAYS